MLNKIIRFLIGFSALPIFTILIVTILALFEKNSLIVSIISIFCISVGIGWACSQDD